MGERGKGVAQSSFITYNSRSNGSEPFHRQEYEEQWLIAARRVGGGMVTIEPQNQILRIASIGEIGGEKGGK